MSVAVVWRLRRGKSVTRAQPNMLTCELAQSLAQ